MWNVNLVALKMIQVSSLTLATRRPAVKLRVREPKRPELRKNTFLLRQNESQIKAGHPAGRCSVPEEIWV